MSTKEIFSIPNILSLVRIALIPFILWAFFSELVWVSAGLIVLSGLTDLVDGYVARRYNMITALGKVLDPIADKLTLFAIIIALCSVSKVVFVVLGLFVIKEILLGVEGLVILKKTKTTYSAQWHGKLTTFFLYFTMIVHVVWTGIPDVLSFVLLCICNALMIMTLILYTIRNINVLRGMKGNSQSLQIDTNNQVDASSVEAE